MTLKSIIITIPNPKRKNKMLEELQYVVTESCVCRQSKFMCLKLSLAN